MSTLIEIPRRLYTAAQVRELDRTAIEKQGIAGIDLMERAGAAAWNCLSARWNAARCITVVCGAGNNAGDGYVIARLAREAGLEVTLVALTDPGRLKGDAHTAAENYREIGTVAGRLDGVDLAAPDVVVDAILGTGLDRDLEGVFLDAVRRINATAVPVMSVDIPSGLNADTGLPMGDAVHADVTVTFIGHKQGLFTGSGAGYRGMVVFEDLEVPASVHETVPTGNTLIDVDVFRHLLPRRSRIAHKGDFGHVLVVGGEYGFAGAARMCGVSAARTGAGLVSLATRPEHAWSIPASAPELMASGIGDPGDLAPMLERTTVAAVGPGLGQSKWSRRLFTCMLETDLPLVVDADALNLLAQDPLVRDNWILTPHPGEAARLLGVSTGEVQADRFTAADRLQERYGGVVVLKGAGSIVTPGDRTRLVCHEGNPGMATGGMGDVLTGIIAGLVAQGCSLAEAAGLGVCLHARAADLCAGQAGERGMLATDLLPYLRKLVNPD